MLTINRRTFAIIFKTTILEINYFKVMFMIWELAAYFNLENELGKIAIHNWADLVILDANPLEDINNTKQINAVIKQGKYFNREHLDGLLNNLTTEEY